MLSTKPKPDGWVLAVCALAWLASYFVAALAIAHVLVTSIKHEKPLLARVLACFVCTIFVFAGIYYSMACIGDYNDAVHKLIYYEPDVFSPTSGLLLTDSERAFRGIENRRWCGVELLALRIRHTSLSPQEIQVLPATELLAAAAKFKDSPPVSNPADAFPLFVDCLHFSTATITTLGYGDIAPRTVYAKLAADAEVLSGVFIVAVSLGTYFNRSNGTKPTQTD